jgi:dephospho-CoA kinase
MVLCLQIVHGLYKPGGRAVESIGVAFPAAIKNHSVDRVALAAVLKEEPGKLKTLESIVHPLVKEEKIREIQDAASENEDIVVLDIPLLFETHSEKMCDAVMVVTADKKVQQARVMERPGMTAEKFNMLIARQMSEEERIKRADFVVRTDTSIEETMESVASIFTEVKTRPRGAFQRILCDAGTTK